jgi:hypothetical protein
MSTERLTEDQTRELMEGDPQLPTVVEKRAVLAIKEMLGSVGQPALHNFHGKPEEVWRATALANSPQCLKAADVRGKELAVVHFYASRVQISGPTQGEYIEAIRCVLIDKNGIAVAFVSDGIAADLAQMIYTFGLQKWEPPVLVKIEEVTTRRGWRTYRIVPA